MKNRNTIFTTILLALACFAFSQTARAVSPAPDGGYLGGNTAEGTNALFSLTTGAYNTALGFQALYSNATAGYNTATGHNALKHNRGNYNTANGANALESNTDGFFNTATGSDALLSNTTGYQNTAVGFEALYSNTSGIDNTAIGLSALTRNTSGHQNTATGFQALSSNTIGADNTANGVSALFNNTSGFDNTANGHSALAGNTTGHDNTATGVAALDSNTTGNYNTATGYVALGSNTNGTGNTASGSYALFYNNGSHNTAVGFQALQNNTGSNNIALGFNAGSSLTTGSNNIDIGALGVAGESNTIRLGKSGLQTSAYVQGIYGKTVASGVGVIVGSNGQLGTVVSSARFKDEIKPMDKASEAILALKPVTFHYKKELDPDGIPQFGLVAEQVEKVNPDLVARDADGKVYTVRYEAVNAMLLNEFLKEHRAFLREQGKMEQLEKQVEKLTAGLQSVSAQVEVTKAAPKLVLNGR